MQHQSGQTSRGCPDVVLHSIGAFSHETLPQTPLKYLLVPKKLDAGPQQILGSVWGAAGQRLGTEPPVLALHLGESLKMLAWRAAAFVTARTLGGTQVCSILEID